MTCGIRRIAPVFFCLIAAASVIAAGFVVFDARDDISTSTDEATAEFASYEAESEPLDAPPPTNDAFEIAWDDIDWDRIRDDDDWETLRAVDDHQPRPVEDGEPTIEDHRSEVDSGPAQIGQARQATGRLVVITNFTRANVTVNGESYPAYSEDGQNRGVELPAYEPHEVFVEFDDHERIYEVELDAGEERLLMVELTGMGASDSSRSPRSRRSRDRQRDDDDDDIDDDEGRITVYSRPRGDIYVGERDMGEQTPGTVDVDPGRHEVQVQYGDGEMSETKTVRVRQGARVKLFFRQDDD